MKLLRESPANRVLRKLAGFRGAEGGFTLIELLLVIGIFGIIGVAVFNTYFNSWQSWEFNRDKVNIQQAHRAVISRITPFLREATLIKISLSGDQLIMQFTEKGPSGARYNLLEAGVYNDKFYLKKGYTDGINFNWQEPVLLSGTDSLLVIRPLFTYQESKKIVMVELTLRTVANGGDHFKDYRFSDSIFLRNEDIVTEF